MFQTNSNSDRIPPLLTGADIEADDDGITDIHDPSHAQYANHNHHVPALPPPPQPPPLQRRLCNDLSILPVPPPPPLLVPDALPTTLNASEAKECNSSPPDRAREAMRNSLPESGNNSSQIPIRSPTVFNDYESYLKILQKIEIKIGPKNAGCFAWKEDSPISLNGSVHCKACDLLVSYSGYWTKGKPIRNYNMYKFVCHIKSRRHRKAVTRDALMEIQYFSPSEQQQIVSQQMSIFKALLNKFMLLLFYSKKNYPFRSVHDLTVFIEQIGGAMDANYYANHGGVREMISSIAGVQESIDYGIVRRMCDGLGFWLSLDGQKRAGLSLKVFGVRGIPKDGFYISERYLDILPMNKGTLRPYGIHDGLTINSGEDQLKLVDEIITKIGKPNAYQSLNGISSDGDRATLGKHKGLIAQIQKKRNKSCLAFSAICHRSNHVLMSLFLKLSFLKEHVQKLKDLSALLHDSIPAQILAAFQDLDDVCSGSVIKPYEKRWNYMYQPMCNVDKHLPQILKSLTYMKANREGEDEQKRCGQNYKHFSNIENIVINQVCAVISIEGNKLMKNLSIHKLDKVAAFIYLYEYIEIMTMYNEHGIIHNNRYIQEAKRRQRYKERLVGGRIVRKVVIDKYEWTLEDDSISLDGYYNQIARKITTRILHEYRARFDDFERVVYKQFIEALDPASFRVFGQFAAVKTHGNEALMAAIREKQKLRNANGRTMFVYNEHVVLAQYEMSKKELYRLRNVTSPHHRIREYFTFLMQKKHSFTDLVHFLKD